MVVSTVTLIDGEIVLKIRFDRRARRWYGGIDFDSMTVNGMPEWHTRTMASLIEFRRQPKV